MAGLSASAKDEVKVLTFNGSLEKEQEEDIMGGLMESLGSYDRVVVNFEEVRHIAPQCLRLFCIASSVAGKMNKQILFSKGNLNLLKEKLTKDGDDCGAECVLLFNRGCLWKNL